MSGIWVGLGGAAGALMRYAISLIPYKGEFPLLTLVTNILGAILIGFIVGTGAKNQWPKEIMLFLKTGLCGGFTTFSTFSLEAYDLIAEEQFLSGGIYIVLSVIMCLAGIWIGAVISDYF